MMRLDKFFSELKIFSRREIAGELKKGFVKVNGVVIKKADFKVDENKDVITYKDEVVWN